MGSVRALSYVEGRVVEVLLGVRMPRRLPLPPGGGFWDKVKGALADMRTWSSLAYMLLMLPLGIVYFTVAVTCLALAGGFAFAGGAVLIGDVDHVHIDGGPLWLIDAVHTPVAGAVFIALGVVIFFLMLHVARLIGWLHGRVAEQLLVRV
jgi:hypothetical protein